jgi:hypothetical protein
VSGTDISTQVYTPDDAPKKCLPRLLRRPRLLPAMVWTTWVALVALALLAPALAHGAKLGSYDIGETFGLGSVPGVIPHNSLAGDQVQEMAPWTYLNWLEVHSGHLPLWNPYSGLGLPQLFDWQSAGFSLPMLVAYAFPLRFAYDIVVIMRLIICGTGVLFFCRRALGLDWTSAAFAATVAELSGSFSGWSGWPMAGVFCWLGWIAGAVLLILRGQNRFRWVLLLALAVGCSVYGGHPESLVIMAAVLAMFVIVAAVAEIRRRGWRCVASATGSLVGAGVAGAALCAPLWLPGALTLRHTVQSGRSGYVPLPLHAAIDVALSGYFGYPTANSTYFGPADYYEAAAFVGVLALMLAALAVAMRWRQPEVAAIGIVVVVLGLLAYSAQIADIVDRIPVVRLVGWTRGLIPLDLLLGVLAGIGLQSLHSTTNARCAARRFTLIAAVGSAAVLALAIHNFTYDLPGKEGSARDRSIEWAALQAIVALVVAAALVIDRRRKSASRHTPTRPMLVSYMALGVLVATVVVFLLAGTPNLWSSNHTGSILTSSEATLRREAAGDRVGYGACPSISSFSPALGILPESNIEVGISELGIYDPILPVDYSATYAALTHTPAIKPTTGNFCPSLTTATIARHYGVSLILEAAGAPAPAGAVRDGSIDGEDVYKVPGSGIVTIEPAGTAADSPAAHQIRTSGADPEVVHFTTDAAKTSTVYLHIGNFSGWTATIDGHPLRLRTWATIEMAATVPPGHHVITLHYDPKSFKAGEGLFALGVAGLLVAGAVVGIRGRMRSERR